MDRIVLNNFSTSEARSFAQLVRSDAPELSITFGEEHGATPSEWVEVILTVHGWLHWVAPYFKDLTDGAVKAIGAAAAGALWKKLTTGRQPASPASVEGGPVARAIAESSSKRTVLSLELPSGSVVRYTRSESDGRDLASDLQLFSMIAKAVQEASTRVEEPDDVIAYGLLVNRESVVLEAHKKEGKPVSVQVDLT